MDSRNAQLFLPERVAVINHLDEPWDTVWRTVGVSTTKEYALACVYVRHPQIEYKGTAEMVNVDHLF